MTVDSLELPRWASTVHLVAEDPLREEILEALGRPSGPTQVTVTDLLDLRTGFYRRRAEVPIPPERRELLETGRELHAAFAAAVAEPAFREVRVRRAGVSGQVDVWDRFPIEFKTTSRLPSPDAVSTDRPDYVEQLGMYCALLGEPRGRLVIVQSAETPDRDVLVLDGRFRDLPAIEEEIGHRAETLREALEQDDPSGLPACAWRTRDCPYAVNHICACTGAERPREFPIRDRVDDLHRNPEEEARLSRILRSPGFRAPIVRRYRDLMYPRRTFYERTRPSPSGETPLGEAKRPVRGTELYRQLSRVVVNGLSSPGVGLTGPAGYPDERVVTQGGTPILTRTTLARPPLRVDQFLERAPQYVFDLALRCTALGVPEGLLVVGYERGTSPNDRVKVARLRLESGATFEAMAQERTAALRSAIESGDPSGLLPCPAWMFSGCPYREVCGCAAATVGAGRTQR